LPHSILAHACPTVSLLMLAPQYPCSCLPHSILAHPHPTVSCIHLVNITLYIVGCLFSVVCGTYILFPSPHTLTHTHTHLGVYTHSNVSIGHMCTHCHTHTCVSM